MNKIPLIGIKRLCIGTDGRGITTLVAFHGCPLRCKFCLNPRCLNENGIKMELTTQEIINFARKDELYFIATNGGITFGGGEPLLKADAIINIIEQGAYHWNTTIETSLNVPLSYLEIVAPFINEYIVDIKDMSPNIYESYTGKDNEYVIENLKWLISQGKKNQIIVRIPLIKGYNTNEDRERSCLELKKIGLNRFDLFNYITNINDYRNGRKKEM